MQSESPVRWGGLAALLAGALIVLSELLRLYIDLVDPGLYRSVFPFDGVLGLLLAVLVQLGLVGLYARQARSVGTMGLVGFVLGWVLLGVATLRARIYPRTSAMLLIAGALILLLPLPLGGVVFAAAVAWM